MIFWRILLPDFFSKCILLLLCFCCPVYIINTTPLYTTVRQFINPLWCFLSHAHHCAIKPLLQTSWTFIRLTKKISNMFLSASISTYNFVNTEVQITQERKINETSFRIQLIHFFCLPFMTPVRVFGWNGQKNFWFFKQLLIVTCLISRRVWQTICRTLLKMPFEKNFGQYSSIIDNL